MEKEEQLTSLELSKRLKELGVKQDSAFYWILEKEDGTEKEKVLNNHQISSWNDKELYNYSAFSIAELGEMLPESVKQIGIGSGTLRIEKDEYGDWSITYVGTYICTTSEKLADAMARILIHLIGNKLIKM